MFEQVIERDPAFAPAYAGLVDAYAFMSMEVQGIPSETALSRMRPAAVKAIELDPLLAEAHAAMGLLHSRERDWESAQRSFQRAIDLNPSLTRTYTNYATSTLIPLGKVDEAERLLGEALRADPLSLDVRRELAMAQIMAGRYEEAIANLQRVRAVDPDFPFADLFLARALTFAGRLPRHYPVGAAKRRTGLAAFWMAYAYVMAGRRAEVERIAAAHVNPFRLAIIYAAWDKDRALRGVGPGRGHPAAARGAHTDVPEMASLRGDARFAAIRRKLGLP